MKTSRVDGVTPPLNHGTPRSHLDLLLLRGLIADLLDVRVELVEVQAEEAAELEVFIFMRRHELLARGLSQELPVPRAHGR